MKTAILLLPSLAAICYGAALPLTDDYTLTVTVTGTKTAARPASTAAPAGSAITLTKTVTAVRLTTATSTSKRPATTAAPPPVTVYKTITDILPSTVYVTTTDDGSDDDGGDDSATTTVLIGGITLGGWGPRGPPWRHFTKREASEEDYTVTQTVYANTQQPQQPQNGPSTTTEYVYASNQPQQQQPQQQQPQQQQPYNQQPYNDPHNNPHNGDPHNGDPHRGDHHGHHHPPNQNAAPSVNKRSPQSLDFPTQTEGSDSPVWDTTAWLSWLTLAKKTPKTETAVDCAGAASHTTAAPARNLIPAFPWWSRPTAVTVTVTSYIDHAANQAPLTAKKQDALDMISRTLIEEAAATSTSSSPHLNSSTVATSTKARFELRD